MLASPSDLVDLLECEHRSHLGRDDRRGDPDELHAQASLTAAAMRAGQELIENAVFFDGAFHCSARTLVRTPAGYEPCEEAGEATPLAVLNLTAAAQAIGAERAHLIIDGRRSSTTGLRDETSTVAVAGTPRLDAHGVTPRAAAAPGRRDGRTRGCPRRGASARPADRGGTG